MGANRDGIDPVKRNSLGCRLLAHTKKFQSVGTSIGVTRGDKRPITWGNLSPRSGEMAMPYRGFSEQGPHLLTMRSNPGWFSAPHTYATDRICVVVSGAWWVNSGNKSGDKFVRQSLAPGLAVDRRPHQRPAAWPSRRGSLAAR